MDSERIKWRRRSGMWVTNSGEFEVEVYRCGNRKFHWDIYYYYNRLWRDGGRAHSLCRAKIAVKKALARLEVEEQS